MKKLIVIGLIVSNVAYADTKAFAQWLGPMMIGGAISTSLKNLEYKRQDTALENKQVEVLPANVAPPLFKSCELRSVQINGQVVTNQYCY